MFKIGVTTFVMTLAMACAELPVNSYLPPRTSTSDGNGVQSNLSTQYGVPSFNGGELNKNTVAATGFGNAADSAYNGPSRLYGAPVGGNAVEGGSQSSPGESRGNGFVNGQLSDSYGVPNDGGSFRGNGFDRRPLSSYGIPTQNNPDAHSFGGNDANKDRPNNYNVAGANENNGNGRNSDSRKPSTGYGVPDGNARNFVNGNTNRKSTFSAGNGNSEGSSNSYVPPRVESGRKTGGINVFAGDNGGTNSGYGAFSGDSNNNNNDYSAGSTKRNGGNFGNDANANGYPSGRPQGDGRHLGNDGNGGGFSNGEGSLGYNANAQNEDSKPTKYEFSYEVKDERSGSNYGHTETRDGDRAQGEFNVLLPDGRKQIVEYEADQDGFKPQIRYEGEANTGGYGSNGLNSNDGYSSDRPDSKGSGFTDNSGFNGDTGNGGYPNGRSDESAGFNNGAGNGYQTGRAGQSVRDNHSGLNGNIDEYFSNVPNNNIGDTFKGNDGGTDVGSNKRNDGGYQY